MWSRLVLTAVSLDHGYCVMLIIQPGLILHVAHLAKVNLDLPPGVLMEYICHHMIIHTQTNSFLNVGGNCIYGSFVWYIDLLDQTCTQIVTCMLQTILY